MHLESTYQKHLSDLQEISSLVQNSSAITEVDLKTCDVNSLKHLIQQNKVSSESTCRNIHLQYQQILSTHTSFFQDTESNLQKEARMKLEDLTFDIQCFISEHAQFLSPAQSSHLLKFLSSTQRAFREQSDSLVSQRDTLHVLLDAREKENQQEVCLWKNSRMFCWILTVHAERAAKTRF